MSQWTLYDAPAQSHSPTSIAAAEAIEPRSETLRRLVLEHLRKCVDGSTDEEIQTALGMGGNTARPRRIELVKAGLVKDSGRTRLTMSGRKAVVWVAV